MLAASCWLLDTATGNPQLATGNSVAMSIWVLLILLIPAGLFLILERRGVPVTLSFDFKGDIKRESRWFAQYGHPACTGTAALLMWRLDPLNRWGPLAVIVATAATSVTSFLVKRLAGRSRPGRPQAGQFLGPTLAHANWRESFPSSHSAAAAAFAFAMSHYYPQAAPVFWALALICAALRYILEAHWPSDVFAGLALGYTTAAGALMGFEALVR